MSPTNTGLPAGPSKALHLASPSKVLQKPFIFMGSPSLF